MGDESNDNQANSTSDTPETQDSKDVKLKQAEAKSGPGNGVKTKSVSGKSQSSIKQLEKGYYQNFLNPMFAELAKQAKKNEDILDEINKQIDEGNEARRKEHLGAHIPDVIKGHGKKMEDIVHDLEAMIINEDFDTDKQHSDTDARIQRLDEHNEAAVLAHSLAAHIQTLDIPHLAKITEKVKSNCQQWLTKLFRFKEGSLMYHEHEWDGIVKICHLALHQHYPKYATEGFEAVYSRPPVVYVSAAATAGYGQYICAQLGLPMSCLNIVPCNTMFGSHHKMDVGVFEKLVQDDIAAAKTPVLLVAYAGTPVVGHVDKLERLQEICEKNSIWLHVEGSHLATLTMFSVPTSVSPAKSGDSMTVSLSPWLGIAGLPAATIYKQVDPALAQSIGLDVFNPSIKLSCLPLWVCLQSLGHEGIVDRVKFSCDLAKLMFEKLCEIPSIKQVSKEKEAKKENKEISISSLISRAIHAMIIFEIVSPTVVFKFTKPVKDSDQATTPQYSLTEEEQIEAEATRIYYDSLNAWLCEGLAADNPSIALSAVDVEREGVCIRFNPLESAQVLGTTVEDVETFVESVKQHIAILQTTVDNRDNFNQLVSQDDRLEVVNKPNWAGLGIVQYQCEDPADINAINTELVHKLKNSDAAFSLGDIEGCACVRFGLISEGTSLPELVNLVATIGREVEEASKYLERMTDVIKKGIDATNKELEKEVENKLRTEGVLRQVPLVGALVNWWSPPPKDVMTGRTFDMQSGEVKSTKTTYKYHMQIQQGSTPTSPSPTPDTPTSREDIPSPTSFNDMTPNLNSGPLVIGSASEQSSSSTSPFMQLDTPTDGNTPQTVES